MISDFRSLVVSCALPPAEEVQRALPTCSVCAGGWSDVAVCTKGPYLTSLIPPHPLPRSTLPTQVHPLLLDDQPQDLKTLLAAPPSVTAGLWPTDSIRASPVLEQGVAHSSCSGSGFLFPSEIA